MLVPVNGEARVVEEVSCHLFAVGHLPYRVDQVDAVIAAGVADLFASLRGRWGCGCGRRPIRPGRERRVAAQPNLSGVERTTSVSRHHSGVSLYGVYDMVGNVWEWLATATTPGRYELRGSAFTSPLFRGAPAISNDANETMHDDDTGFRCVATPKQTEPRKR
ncbi:SUMF1/EgtB/PvdO family nonheme iron enzyme [Streptomyces sp. NPDC057611]|uniref:SUMF1/EgtB/PvdO family nonheme iron enzyme n=1 Tax=Streptomyces sp. NPDC057611 TaxID=3346182 RepID=UPI0036C58CE3